MKTSRRRNLVILAFTLVVVTLGFGLVLPILPFYIEELGAGGTEMGLLVASYAVMRLIFGPIWGALSDRIGRKPVLMVGVLGYGLTMVGFGLATKLWMVFAARILSGVLSSATSPTPMAFIADSTSEEERSRGLGLLGAAGGVGAIFGPAIGGLLADISLPLPFFTAAACSFAALVFLILLLPESLPEGNRMPAPRQGRQHSFRTARQAVSSPLGTALLLVFLVTAGVMIFYGVLGLYALKVFRCSTEQTGWIFTVLGLVTALGQGVLIGPLTSRWGDAAVIRSGFVLSAVCLPLILLAGSYGGMLVLVALFSLVNAVLVPAITALTSRITRISQGVTMGFSNAAVSLGRIAGPLLGGLLFDRSAQLPFWAGGLFMLSGFIVSLLLRSPRVVGLGRSLKS